MRVPILLCLLLALAAAGNDKPPQPRPYFADDLFARIILLTSDSRPPPNPLLDILDPGHVRMKTFYTEAQIAAKMQVGINWINEQFGINFGAAPATPHPAIPGAIIYPGLATLYPYGTDPTQKESRHYRMAADSAYPKRGDKQKWVSHEYGFLILMTTTGVFPGGRQAGTAFNLNEVISHGEYHFFNIAKNWTHPSCATDENCREVLTFRAVVPTLRPINSYTYIEELLAVEVVDKWGRICQTQGAGKIFRKEDGTQWRRNRFMITCDWVEGDRHAPNPDDGH